MNFADAIVKLAEKTVDNSQVLKKTRLQRRTEFTDLYGVPFTAQGDANNPATFYISISPDLVYYLRFQFKLHIQPFTSTVTGGTGSATVTVNDRSLSVSGSSVSPNPHSHTTQSHTHNIINGITVEHTAADDFRVLVDGIDITAYLIAQQDGEWIEGEGIYPSDELVDDEEIPNSYDLLEVASTMYAEGNEEDAETILKPEFKEISVASNAPFAVTLYLYCKHSNMGR